MTAFHRRALLASLTLLAAGKARAQTAITLTAADGVSVFAERGQAQGRRRGAIALFHMAGANRGEYAPIAPRLNRLGFDTLAIDQRSGGTLYGRRNETVAKLGHDTDFPAALPDLQAALAALTADPRGGPILVWGSSYSAALVFALAARQPAAIAGVLAFSPGEYIRGLRIRAEAARLACPAFVASSPAEAGEARPIFDAVRVPGGQFQVLAPGAHGSSALHDPGNPQAAASWAAVEFFLTAVAA